MPTSLWRLASRRENLASGLFTLWTLWTNLRQDFWGGAACKCDTHKALDFTTFWFGTRRPLVQIQSPRHFFKNQYLQTHIDTHIVADRLVRARRSAGSNRIAPTTGYFPFSHRLTFAMA